MGVKELIWVWRPVDIKSYPYDGDDRTHEELRERETRHLSKYASFMQKNCPRWRGWSNVAWVDAS